MILNLDLGQEVKESARPNFRHLSRPWSGILTTSGNTSSQKSQTVGDFYNVIGRIGIISTLKVMSQTSQTSAIFTMSVNLAVLESQ